MNQFYQTRPLDEVYITDFGTEYTYKKYRELYRELRKNKISVDRLKCRPKQLHEFIVKCIKIMAASRKDAIKKYNHLKVK